MKGLIFATLAVSLLGGASALAQSDASMVGKITGKTFYAADGSSLAFLAYKGGLAREIHTASGAVIVETLALKNGHSGTVSEDDNALSGTFTLSSTALATDYKDGRSELLTTNESGGLEMSIRDADGALICTAWYPQGHRFSDAEIQAALIDVAARLDLDTPRAGTQQSCAPTMTREARAHVHRRTAQSAGTVVARIPE